MTMHKQTVDNLKLRIGELETKHNDLKLKVTKLGKTGRGASKRVYDDLSTRQKKRICLKVQELSKTSLQFLEGYNFKSVKLELYNGNTDRFETIDVMGNEVCSKRKTDLSNNVADKINMALLIKDKFCLSDKAYMELSTLSEDMPSLYKLKHTTTELNKRISMHSTPDGTIGMQVKLCDLLMQNVPYINIGDKLRIKITGDGTRLHVVNIGYTIINEGRKAMSGKGKYCLAIVKMDENFESLSTALHDLMEEMENLSEIQINDKIYTCEYYLGVIGNFLPVFVDFRVPMQITLVYGVHVQK